MSRSIMTSTAKTLAEQVGRNIFHRIREDLGDELEALGEEAVLELKKATELAGQIAVRAVGGEDVSMLAAGLEASVANWTYVKASRLQRAFWSAVDTAVGGVGQFLGAFAAGALGRLA